MGICRRGNNGGWNKSHGQIENTPRIDSFEAGAVEGWGTLFSHADKGLPLALDCCRSIEYGPEADKETVIVLHPKEGWSRELELSRKPNGCGGDQAFFLCPACGERRRYLYQAGATFLCRKCSRLNYKSQQESKSDSMYFYHKGLDLVEKRLDTWPRVRPDGFSFCGWVPERPRYMHKATFVKYFRRLLRYQEKHYDREMADLARLLKIYGEG